ncbi:M14 family metallopeptidase [Flavimarina sp. Hel_I_48]|uniref:M14 family metallopeptidase n=1 Tax=Flavimarina sp. Hel_I_48 TaxID=1392488 RepID=UPI0004DFC165|nr:M14 family metallopeptidase [Flavimarina sp. Hel_I_48]
MSLTYALKKLLFLPIFGISCLFSAQSQTKTSANKFITLFEESNGTKTPTYKEVMQFYQYLDCTYPAIKTYKIGLTDSGEPLTLVTYNPSNPDRTLQTEFSKNPDLYKLLINNGIHPGEPDGIDATMMLFRDAAQGKINIPKNVWLGAITIYNVGGALNRNSTSRTNQNGPESYGFRGNARNFDLNRDFIKADTRNAQSFAQLYHSIDPEMFIDNHVSNGADYQYTLTHLFTQHDKMGGKLGDYIKKSLQPQLENLLAAQRWDITPYVNVFNEVPETGFSQFMDYPRYSTGYTTLWNTVGMMVETHMLKPYKPRVEGTYALLRSMIDILAKDGKQIKELRTAEKESYSSGARVGTSYPLAFEIDNSKVTTFDFKGYEGKMIPSKLTGKQRLKYDRSKPFTKPVRYYDNFKEAREVTIPKYYVIPQGWFTVLDRLRENNIELQILKTDTTLQVESYHIADYKTRESAYEGHYMHSNTKVNKEIEKIKFRKGDVLVSTAQPGMRYLLETLEPAAPDSFFNWNYFDTILQQKEGFSPYVWEDKAKELLDNNAGLQEKFEEMRRKNADFANNWYAQLDWLHKHSPNYEKAHLLYPIFRIKD